MAGHSKWAQIKHKKAVTDARRGAEFTKLARAIQVAARDGGGDPAGNASLANAIQKAKDAGMPKQNIERAIAKGTGADTDADAIETVVYEGYGPGGVAILVEALTDNRNRTGSEVRHVFSRSGGSLGEPGSVGGGLGSAREAVLPKCGPGTQGQDSRGDPEPWTRHWPTLYRCGARASGLAGV